METEKIHFHIFLLLRNFRESNAFINKITLNVVFTENLQVTKWDESRKSKKILIN